MSNRDQAQQRAIDAVTGAKVSRRRVMQAGGGLGIGAALAPLLGLGTNALAQGAASPTGGEYHGWWPYTQPPVGHFNSFVTDAITMGIYQGVSEVALAQYQWDGAIFTPLLATKWESPNEHTYAVELRGDVTWSDGSKFSADDVLTTFSILRAQKTPVWDYVGSVKAVDPTHVEFELKNPSTVVPYFVLRTAIRAHSVYGDWAKKFDDVFTKYPSLATPVAAIASGATPAGDGSTAALASVIDEFNKFKPDHMVVTGPYNFDTSSITSSQLTMNKVETSAWVKTANFDRLVLFNQTDAASIPALILSKNCDYSTSGFPPATEKAMIQAGLRIVRPPTYFGPALYINYAKVKSLTNPKARQALTKAIDRGTNGKISLGDSGISSKYMTGVPDTLIEQWVSKDTLGKLNSYAQNVDEASATFQELGFKKDGDVWTSPEGERMEYELMAPSENSDWAAAATNLADQLTAFGVKTTVRLISQTQVATDRPNGNYQFAIGPWGSGQPHPIFSYRVDLINENTANAHGGFHFPMAQKTESAGEIDFAALIEQSAAGMDVEAQKKIIEKLAMGFNELLPIIPLWERLANDPILVDVRVTGFPPDSDPLFKNSVYSDNFTMRWILDGTLKGVKK